jgi:hypothetical protein
VQDVNIKARTLLAIAGIVFAIVACWLGGFDFNERGGKAMGCLLLAAFLGGMGFACPLFDRDLK